MMMMMMMLLLEVFDLTANSHIRRFVEARSDTEMKMLQTCQHC